MVCREEKNWSPETAYQRAFYGKRAFAGKALRWMEHEARRRGMHINQQISGHGGEKVIAGYRVNDFCLETNTVFQFHGCHWYGCPKCYPTPRKKLVAFEKTKQVNEN